MFRRLLVLLAPVALFAAGGVSAFLLFGGDAVGETPGAAVHTAAPAAVVEEPAPAQVPPISRGARSQVIKDVLPSSVRIQLSAGGRTLRVASGVILGFGEREAAEGGAPTRVGYVITNAHVVEAPDPGVRYEVLVDRRGRTTNYPARVVARGEVPEMDLALLEVPNLEGSAARLADDADFELGDEVVAVGAPFGRGISISSGIVSQLQWDEAGAAQGFKTDAPIGYGASGGGIFRVPDGKLLAVIEGYRTAKVSFPLAEKSYSFDVPMPGETFASPAAKVRAFLRSRGVAHLLADLFPPGSVQEPTRTAAR